MTRFDATVLPSVCLLASPFCPGAAGLGRSAAGAGRDIGLRRDHGGRRQRDSRGDSRQGRRRSRSSRARQGRLHRRRHARPRRAERGTPSGWSSPAFLTLTGGSVGLQIGGQAADIILVINDRRGLENLVRNQFKLGADARSPPGRWGATRRRPPTCSCARRFSATRARAACSPGVTINGSTVRQDRDANERFYGKRLETKQILFEGGAGAPPPVPRWLETLKRFAE